MWGVWLPSAAKAGPELCQAGIVLLHFGQATQVLQEDTCLRGPKGVWYRQLSPGGSVTGCSAGGVPGTLKPILAKWLSRPDSVGGSELLT